MGTKKLGDNLQLFVKDASGTGFSRPDGQGNLTINRSDSPIDASDKNSGDYAEQIPGQQTLTITVAIQPKLPDTAYARMKTLSQSPRAPEIYQVREAPFEADDVLFACNMWTSFGNLDAPQKGVVATSVTLSVKDAPTVDLL